MDDLLLSLDGQVNAISENDFPYFVFKFKQNININILDKCINNAMQIHPLFSTKIVKKGKWFYFVPNEKKAIIKPIEEFSAIKYGNSQYNDFPWIITIDKNKLIFTCAHALCDGMGAISFLKDIIMLYYTKINNVNIQINNKKPANFKKLSLDNSYNIKLNFNQTNSITKKTKKVASLSKKVFEYNTKKIYKKRYLIDKQDITFISKNNNTNISSILSSLLAASLSDALKLNKHYIEILLPIDLRKYFNSYTDRSFIYTASLFYDIKKYNNVHISESSKDLCNQFNSIVERDNLNHIINKIQHDTKMIHKHPLFLNFAKRSFKKMLYSPKATIVYTHLTNLGFENEIENWLDDFFICGPNISSFLLVVVASTFKNKISIIPCGYFKNNIWYKHFEKKLKQCKINYRTEIVKDYPIMTMY